MELENRAEDYHGEVALDDRYHAFAHLVNDAVSESDTPRTLAFQGSYMNGKGWPYLGNALHEYIKGVQSGLLRTLTRWGEK